MATNIEIFDWANATNENICVELKRLDQKFDTDKRSPLHHDNRCKLHGGYLPSGRVVCKNRWPS